MPIRWRKASFILALLAALMSGIMEKEKIDERKRERDHERKKMEHERKRWEYEQWVNEQKKEHEKKQEEK